jgi:hypothetical protein
MDLMKKSGVDMQDGGDGTGGGGSGPTGNSAVRTICTTFDFARVLFIY